MTKVINLIKKNLSLTKGLLVSFLIISGGFSEIKPLTSFYLDFKKKNQNKNITVKGTLKKGLLFYERTKEKIGRTPMVAVRVPVDGKKRTIKVNYKVIKKGDPRCKFIIAFRGDNQLGASRPKPIMKETVTKVGSSIFEQSLVFKKILL